MISIPFCKGRLFAVRFGVTKLVCQLTNTGNTAPRIANTREWGANSSYRPGQIRLKDDFVGNGRTVEVRSSNKKYVSQGDMIGIKNILQISVDDKGLLIFKVK
jgi:hypothetical protein